MEHDLPTSVSRPARAITSRSTSASTATTLSARSTPSARRRASDRSRLGQRARLREQRLAGALREDRPVGRLPGREAQDGGRDAPRTCSARRHALRSPLHRARRRSRCPPRSSSSSRTTATCSTTLPAGTRPRLDAGTLGIVTVRRSPMRREAASSPALERPASLRSFRGWSEWAAPLPGRLVRACRDRHRRRGDVTRPAAGVRVAPGRPAHPSPHPRARRIPGPHARQSRGLREVVPALIAIARGRTQSGK